jgi:hypothetical protein
VNAVALLHSWPLEGLKSNRPDIPVKKVEERGRRGLIVKNRREYIEYGIMNFTIIIIAIAVIVSVIDACSKE